MRKLLGTALHLRRVERGFTQRDVANRLSWSSSKIRRIEDGRGVKPLMAGDVLRLLSVYGASDAELDKAANLVKRANAPGWWHQWNDLAPERVRYFYDLEAETVSIKDHAVLNFPGLLQTEEYTEAIMWAGLPMAQYREVKRRVALRKERTKLLTREHDPVRFWALLDESLLRRRVGNPVVMTRQLEHLLQMGMLPNVELRINSLSSGASGTQGFPAFTLLRFPALDMPDIAYVENATSALYMEEPEEVVVYRAAFDTMSIEAVSPENTLSLIRDAIEWWKRAD
ncbi:helix-turn-helix domain-containing protein [Streptomyces carpaticus]|uniref:helix-turn-helix domain-containing protein n=1 Tax=Streptomyces carpaticus TaxID=285558 RepID=UPI002207D1B0|nr:helix-turn-helix domain-containing protein [Streptomyces carpaticus]